MAKASKEIVNLDIFTPQIVQSVESVVNSFERMVKNSNDTKVALARIDAEIRVCLELVSGNNQKDLAIIDSMSKLAISIIDNSSLSSEQRVGLVNKFVDNIMQISEKSLLRK